MKVTGKLKNIVIVCGLRDLYLEGLIYNDTKGRFVDGLSVSTSNVKAFEVGDDGKVYAITRNSVYDIGSLAEINTAILVSSAKYRRFIGKAQRTRDKARQDYHKAVAYQKRLRELRVKAEHELRFDDVAMFAKLRKVNASSLRKLVDKLALASRELTAAHRAYHNPLLKQISA